MGIGFILNNIINESSYNINELSSKVGVNPQTLYSIIRRDNMKADLELLVKICDVLEVDVNVFYQHYLQNKKSVVSLSDEEQEMINDFRELNDIGKNKSREYIKDLATNEKYRKVLDLSITTKDEIIKDIETSLINSENK